MVVVAVFRVMVQVGPGGGELGELKQVRLVDKGASLIALNRGTKQILMAMVSLEYVGRSNSPPLGSP